MATKPINLLVCGGGNAAHTLSCLASSRENVTCRVMSLYEGEAEKWRKALGDDKMVLNVKDADGNETVIKSRPTLITNSSEEVVGKSDVIVITVPAFAHKSYVQAIAPHLKPGTAIFGMPGHPGFDFQCLHEVKGHASDLLVLNFETLPWACRIDTYGREVSIHGTKGSLGCSVINRSKTTTSDPMEVMQYIFGDRPVIHRYHSYLSTNLNARLHCPIMFGSWAEWDGKPVPEIPLIYKGLTKKAAEMLVKVADEMVVIAKTLAQKKPEIDTSDVLHFREWFGATYADYISDPTDLQSMFLTNKALQTMTQPMTMVNEGEYVPDFKSRYYVEDTPFGIVVARGIAECVGVATPNIDEVLLWCQKVIDKEYMVNGKLEGRDIGESRAPQVFGINTLDDLVAIHFNGI